MLRPLILITEYTNGAPKSITKINARSVETAKERIKKEIKDLQEQYPKAKVVNHPMQHITVEINNKQKIRIEMVERF
jgi:hypothetical protein